MNKIKIMFEPWTGKAPLEIDAESVKDAVEKAARDGISMSGANLVLAELSGADMPGIDLSNANLAGAVMCNVNLTNSNLSGANMYGVNLSNSELSGVDMSGVNLYRVNLSKAKLAGAIMPQAEAAESDLTATVLRLSNQVRKCEKPNKTRVQELAAEIADFKIGKRRKSQLVYGCLVELLCHGKCKPIVAETSHRGWTKYVDASGEVVRVLEILGYSDACGVKDRIHARERKFYYVGNDAPRCGKAGTLIEIDNRY